VASPAGSASARLASAPQSGRNRCREHAEACLQHRRAVFLVAAVSDGKQRFHDALPLPRWNGWHHAATSQAPAAHGDTGSPALHRPRPAGESGLSGPGPAAPHAIAQLPPAAGRRNRLRRQPRVASTEGAEAGNMNPYSPPKPLATRTNRWRNEKWRREAARAPPQTNVPGPLGPGTNSLQGKRAWPQAALNSDSASTTSSTSSVRRPRALFDSTSVMRCTAPRSSSRSTAAISRAMRSSALS